MDHLPLGSQEPPIVVPYLLPDDFAYDRGDFHSYPERCGWDFSAWFQNDRTYRDLEVDEWLLANDKSREELLVFLQAWLVFGQLSFALDMEILVDDFTRLLEDGQTKVLTTAKLETYLADIASRFPDPVPGEEPEPSWTKRRKQRERYYNSMSYLAAVFETLNGAILWGNPQIAEELEKIHFVAGLLSHLLSRFMRHILQTPDDIDNVNRRFPSLEFGRSRLIIRHMRANKWCPNTMNRISATGSYSMQAYLYALGTVRTSQDHSKCTSGYCSANQAGTDFEARHLACTGEDCAVLQIRVNEIVQVLEARCIPLVQVCFKGENYTDPYFVVKKADGNTPYVAISHVWADGLGNSKSNAIPLCQLKALLRSLQRIQYVNNKINKKEAKEAGPMMPFWLDTLCIPVDEQYQHLRDFSIQKMHQIYKQAHCALILDPDFAQVKRGTEVYEVLSRVFLSAWITRLWTFQEGYLPEILYIRVKDGIMDLYYIYTSYFQQHRKDWIRARPVLDTLVEDSIGLYMALMPRKRNTKLGVAGPDYDNDTELFVEDSLWSMSWRMTSRLGDETVCFATTLGLDPTSLLGIPQPKSNGSAESEKRAQLRTQEERMVAFLKLLPAIPLSILFFTGPRMSTKGFRWAPRTLLQPQTTLSGGRTMARRHRLGDSPTAYLHPRGKGLVAYLSSILIPRIDFSNTRWRIVCQDGSSFRAGNFFDESSFVGDNGEKKNIVIVLPAMPEGAEERNGLMVRPFGYRTWNPKSPRLSFKTIPAAHILGPVFMRRLGSAVSSDHSTDYVARGASVESKWWLLDNFGD